MRLYRHSISPVTVILYQIYKVCFSAFGHSILLLLLLFVSLIFPVSFFHFLCIKMHTLRSNWYFCWKLIYVSSDMWVTIWIRSLCSNRISISSVWQRYAFVWRCLYVCVMSQCMRESENISHQMMMMYACNMSISYKLSTTATIVLTSICIRLTTDHNVGRWIAWWNITRKKALQNT